MPEIKEKLVHFVFDVTVGLTELDFDEDVLPSDEKLIEVAKDNLEDVMRDWISDGMIDDILATWVDNKFYGDFDNIEAAEQYTREHAARALISKMIEVKYNVKS